MLFRKIANNVKICNSVQQRYFLVTVWCVVLDQGRITIVSEKLEHFHFSYVVHYLELLHKVIAHSCLNHITTSHVPANTSLEYHYVASYHQEYFS